MRVRMRLWVLAFAFLLLTVASLAYAAIEYWNGPGWYMTCFLGLDEEITAGPYANEAACKAVLPASSNDCDYYCVYVDADNLKNYEHYY